MSWDLYVGEEWIGNYTHNTNPMIRAASVWPRSIEPVPAIADEVLFRAPVLGVCWGDFDGRPAREAGLFAEDIIKELERDPEHYTQMNPPNGWGSMKTLLEFLRQVRGRCLECPEATFGASG